jgi:DNA polymerase III subunit delta'
MTSSSTISEQGLYPWLQEPFKHLTSHPVPHSLIISGQKDIGKFQFGFALCKYLLCESQNTKPCEQCEACGWANHGNHPDLFVVVPQNLKHILPFEVEEDSGNEDGEEKKLSKFIRVEQIRNIIASNTLGSYRGGKRVVMIYPAEAMPTEAANCLLKTLEEPSPNLFIVLVTHQIEKLLPTIRSRCQIFHVPKPDSDLSVGWLEQYFSGKYSQETINKQLALQSGAPLSVISSMETKSNDPTEIIKELSKFQEMNPTKIVDLLSNYTLIDILNAIFKWSIDVNFQLFQQKPRFFPEYEHQIQSACQQLDKIAFQNFLTSLSNDLKLANHPLFPKVQLEALLVRYRNLF